MADQDATFLDENSMLQKSQTYVIAEISAIQGLLSKRI